MSKKLFADLNLPKTRYFERDAGFWRRTFALILDLLVLDFTIMIPFESFFLRYDPSKFLSTQAVLSSDTYSALIVLSSLAVSYFVLQQYLIGRTVGMMIMNIRVKEDLGFWKAVLRNLHFIPVFPFAILWVVEPLYLIFKKERFLEGLTGTSTVQTITHQS